MSSKLSLCVAALALAHASPVPYSTEQNYGSSLSATTEAGWLGGQNAAHVAQPLEARGSLTAGEEARTKSLVTSILNKIGVGHAQNKDQALNAIIAKVADGKADNADAHKRDVAGQQEGQQAQDAGRSGWQRVKDWFHGGNKEGRQSEMDRQAANGEKGQQQHEGLDRADNERMQAVNERAIEAQAGSEAQQAKAKVDCAEEHQMQDGQMVQAQESQ